MKPRELKEYLKQTLVNMPNRVTYIYGGVGVGKSSVVAQTCQELGFEMRDIRLSLLDATDLRGLPAVDKEKRETIWTRPQFLPNEDYDKDIVLFFDEFSNANGSIQNATLQLLLDRQLGEYKLPKKARIICAGNRITDGGFVFRIGSANSNRLINIEFETDFDDWKEWAYANNVDPLIVAFHNWKNGTLLTNYAPSMNTMAFASPRSWYFVHELMKAGITNGTLYEAIKGAIGEGAGTEFYGFMKIFRDLPDVKEIMENNKNIIPQESNILYALTGALINYIRGNKTKMDRLVEYSLLIPKEFSVLLIKDLLKTELKEDVMKNKTFDSWVEVNKEIIL
jgi:hypothetical protein